MDVEVDREKVERLRARMLYTRICLIEHMRVLVDEDARARHVRKKLGTLSDSVNTQSLASWQWLSKRVRFNARMSASSCFF